MVHSCSLFLHPKVGCDDREKTQTVVTATIFFSGVVFLKPTSAAAAEVSFKHGAAADANVASALHPNCTYRLKKNAEEHQRDARAPHAVESTYVRAQPVF